MILINSIKKFSLIFLLVTAVIIIGTILTGYYCILSFFPAWRQRATLKKIITKNKNTIFGDKYNFKKIKNYNDFIKSIKINDYEYYRKYIMDSLNNNINYLSNESIKLISTTSGTTGKPKYIPHTETIFKNEFFKSNIMMYFYILLNTPSVIFKPIGLIVSGGTQKIKKNILYQSSANAAYRTSKFRSTFAIPPEVFDIKNYDARYYYMWLFCFIKNVKILITPNPCTIIKIIETAEKYKSNLSNDIEFGYLINIFSLDKRLHSKLNDLFVEIIRDKGILMQAKKNINKEKPIYSSIKSVMCWKSGNCRLFIGTLEKKFNNSVKILNLGYFASDSPLAFHIGSKGYQLPAIDNIFLEFIDMTSNKQNPVLYHQLQKNKKYKIIITNSYGFYRYDIHDIFEVTGFINKSPIINFLQKEEGFSNITGEKLSEIQIIQMTNEIKISSNYDIKFIIAIPDVQASKYKFYIEILKNNQKLDANHLALIIDKKLKNINIEYKEKRDSCRLQIPHVIFLKNNAFEYYKQHFVKKGHKDAQFKIMCLHSSAKHEYLLEEMMNSC